MNKHIPIVFLLLLFNTLASFTQYQPADITRISIDPETNSTTVYFTGTDHPDVNFYYVMKWDIVSENETEPDGVPISASYTEDTGDPDFEYEVSLEISEVIERPIGLYIRPYQNLSTPLTDFPTAFKDSTMHLSVTMDECKNTAELKWNDYNRWRNDILRYRIMVKVDNEDPIVLAELSEDVNSYTASGLQGHSNYLFFVHARRTELDPTEYVISNGVTNSFETIYPDYIHADYGTVGENNYPVLQFSVDDSSDIETFALLRSTQAQGAFDTIEHIHTTKSQIRYTDTEVDASSRPYYYKLMAINSCNQPITESENIAGTVYLEGQLNGTAVDLNWTKYQNWLSDSEQYRIERSFGGESFEEQSTQSGLSFSENLGGLQQEGYSSNVCYRITALENSENPYSPEPGTSKSNLFCVNLPMNIKFNFFAFIPGASVNNDFGPYMEFFPSYFNFKIFNRTGSIVFHSDDPANNPRWDGRLKNGNYAPEGVYRYILQYEDEYGNRSALQGNVTVVRQ